MKWLKEHRRRLIGFVIFILLIVGLIGYHSYYLPRLHHQEGWVEPIHDPVSGMTIGCPSDYPIKANLNSYIYHLPGDPYYARTNANIECFDSEYHAQQQGFRHIY